MEGLASLLVIQFTGRKGKELAEQGEGAQFGLLVGAAAAYVASAWWLVVVSPIQFIPDLIRHSYCNCVNDLLLDIPGCGYYSTVLHAGWRCHYELGVFDLNWICCKANKCHRIGRPCPLCRL